MHLYYKMKTNVVRIWLGPKLYVGIMDADDVELILASNVHLEKSVEYRLFEPWLGDGLLISNGKFRNKLCQAFRYIAVKFLTLNPTYNVKTAIV